MAVQLFDAALMIIMTKAIFFRAAAILDLVEQMVFGKKCECTEYC